MKIKIYALMGLYVLFSGSVLATTTNYQITKKNLQAHVNFLCSDSLEGRLTGSIGEKQATQYIANLFQHLGLEPAGDKGTFFQAFHFNAGVVLGKNNNFVITDINGVSKNLKLGEDWNPLSFSDSTFFKSNELIFADYGITAPPYQTLPSYNSYHNLNVKNKWVIVFSGIPEKISETQNRQISQYSSLRYKAFNAKEHGAKGIIFVNKSQHENRLIPFSSDTISSSAGIIAISMKSSILNDLIYNNHQIKITGRVDIKETQHVAYNVLAKLKLNINSAQMIIISAHADHLGRGKLGGSRALDNETGMIHPGADDNASGVASIIEVATKLSDLKAKGKLSGKKDILFAAWSGEELGVLGSSHFVKNFIKISHKTSLHPHIDALINLDMIGHLRKSLVIQGVGSSPTWPNTLAKLNLHHSISFITKSDPYLPTDSTPFYLEGVPSLNFFTGAHDDYHTPRDKPETLNYAGIKDISEFLVELIQTLEETPNSIAYQAVLKPKDQPEREMRIYLGTIPDYSSDDISGVKLSGVAKNSPAAKAGIKRNDLIIELAGKNIRDIYDYSFVLNTLPVGKKTKLIVLRGQTKKTLMIIAQYRG